MEFSTATVYNRKVSLDGDEHDPCTADPDQAYQAS